MAQTEVHTKVSTNVDAAIKPPPLFRVIYINDDKTTMEFVIESLISFFNYNEDTAREISLSIHESGSAVVAVLPYEVAEQKGITITLNARANGYPLLIKLEPEE
jgi:ATP-dependent Clp protease adaptor protein ClpS